MLTRGCDTCHWLWDVLVVWVWIASWQSLCTLETGPSRVGRYTRTWQSYYWPPCSALLGRTCPALMQSSGQSRPLSAYNFTTNVSKRRPQHSPRGSWAEELNARCNKWYCDSMTRQFDDGLWGCLKQYWCSSLPACWYCLIWTWFKADNIRARLSSRGSEHK